MSRRHRSFRRQPQHRHPLHRRRPRLRHCRPYHRVIGRQGHELRRSLRPRHHRRCLPTNRRRTCHPRHRQKRHPRHRQKRHPRHRQKRHPKRRPRHRQKRRPRHRQKRHPRHRQKRHPRHRQKRHPKHRPRNHRTCRRRNHLTTRRTRLRKIRHCYRCYRCCSSAWHNHRSPVRLQLQARFREVAGYTNLSGGENSSPYRLIWSNARSRCVPAVACVSAQILTVIGESQADISSIAKPRSFKPERSSQSPDHNTPQSPPQPGFAADFPASGSGGAHALSVCFHVIFTKRACRAD